MKPMAASLLSCYKRFLLLAGAGCTPLFGSTWYVDPDGDDGGSGTEPGSAFRTLGQAISVLEAGDELVVGEGVYRESLTAGGSGTAAAPIAIRAAEVGGQPVEVVISGFDEVLPGSGGAGSWSVHAGAIWKIQLGSEAGVPLGRNLVRVDGEVLFPARWPDIVQLPGFDRQEMAQISAGGVEATSKGGLDAGLTGSVPAYAWTDLYEGTHVDAALSSFGADSWRGAHIDVCAGHNWWAKTGVVTGNNGDNLTFQYRFADGWNPVLDTPKEGDRYALWGHLQALDSPGEFFFDVHGLNGPAKTLYLWLPDGGSPEGRQVELLERERSVYLTGDYWIVRNLAVEGGSVETATGSLHNTFDGVSVRFGAVNRNRLHYGSGRAVWLKGDGHEFVNGRVGLSFNRTIQVDGSGTVVENNVLHDAVEHLLTLSGAENATVRRNTGYRAGNTAADIGTTGSLLELNHLYHAGMRITDVATMNTWNGGDLGGTEIRYNWVHSNRAPRVDSRSWWGGQGIRLDSGSAPDGCSNVRIHHNVVWGTTSESSITVWGLTPDMLNYGDAQVKVYQNTVDDHLVLGGDGSVAGNDWRRNIAYGFNDATGNSGEAVVEENLFLQDELADNWTDNPEFQSPLNRNYQLAAASPARDKGTPLPGYTESGPESYLGAYNPAAEPWRPGALARERDLAGLSAEVRVEAEGSRRLYITGLPEGRSFPDGFTVRVDGQTATAEAVRYSFSDHQAEALFAMDFATMSSPAVVEVSLDGGSFTSLPTPLALPVPQIRQVTGPFPGAAGGSEHELEVEAVRGFWVERRPLRFSRLREGDFQEQPVPWITDTGALVADGMATDGRDLRFHRWDGETRLDHMVESGMGDANTLIWLRENGQSSKETDVVSFEDRSLLYYSYGDPLRTEDSNPHLLEESIPALGSTDVLLHLRANRLAESHAAGAPVAVWPDARSTTYDAVQSDPDKQPIYVEAGMGGLPALEFDGNDDVLDVNGAAGLGNGPARFLVVYRNPVPGSTKWQRLFSARANTDMRDYVDGVYAIVATDGDGNPEAVPDPVLKEENFQSDVARQNFRIGGRSLSDSAERFSGQMAELIGFDGSFTGEPREQLLLYLRRKYGIIERPQVSQPAGGILPALRLLVDGHAATGVHWKEEGRIGFTAPPYSGTAPLPQWVDITLELADGSSVVLADAFHYRSAFQEWQALHFGETALADPAQQAGLWGAAADPDGDGLSNALEYATDSHPLDAGSVRRSISGHQAGRVTLRFYRARAELDYVVEGSSNLQEWTTVVVNPASVGEWIEISDTVELTGSPDDRRFLRLRIAGSGIP